MSEPKAAYLRLSEAQRADAEQRIMKLYVTHPYKEVTSRLICGTLSVNPNTLYSWFTTKDDAYIWLFQKTVAKAGVTPDYMWDLDELIGQPQSPDYTDLERQFILTWVKAPENILKALIFEDSFSLTALVYNNLERLKAGGKVRQDIDSRLVAYFYCTAVYNLHHYMKLYNITDVEEKKRLRESMYLDFFQYGIKGEKPERKDSEN